MHGIAYVCTRTFAVSASSSRLRGNGFWHNRTIRARQLPYQRWVDGALHNLAWSTKKAHRLQQKRSNIKAHAQRRHPSQSRQSEYIWSVTKDAWHLKCQVSQCNPHLSSKQLSATMTQTCRMIWTSHTCPAIQRVPGRYRRLDANRLLRHVCRFGMEEEQQLG